MPAALSQPPTAQRAVLSSVLPFRRGGAEVGLPQRFKILSWGENIGRTTGARILVDEAVAETLSAHQELTACDRVPLDYEHQSVPEHPNYIPDPRSVAGHGCIECIPRDGVYLSGVDFTRSGLAHAESYQDVSAVAHLAADGRLLWVSSVALTQRGDVAGMEFSESVAALSAKFNLTNTKPTMTDAPNYREMLIELLDLSPGDSGEVTDEQIIAALSNKPSKPAEAETVSLSAFTDRMDQLEKKALMDDAVRDGKIVPLSDEDVKTCPVAMLSAIIAKLPAGEVPMGSHKAKEQPSEKGVALSADQAAAAKRLGLSAEQYQKGL